MHYHRKSVMVALAFTIASSIVIFSQLGYQQALAVTATPSPAPSKTPTNTPETNNSDENGTDLSESEDNDRAAQFEPFIQSDLSVLTGNVQRPNGVIWHNDMLYSSCNGDWTLYELDSTSGSTITYSAGVRNAHTLFVEGESSQSLDIWLPDYDVNAVVRVRGLQSSPSVVAGDIEGPWGIAYFDEESFLVTSLLGDRILQVSRDGEVNEVVSGLRSPAGIAVTDEYVFVANNGSSRRSIEWISRDDLLDSNTPTVEPLVSGLQSTTGVVYAEDAYLYFAYAVGTRGVVGRVNPEVCIEQGGCTNDQIEIVLYTELPAPLAGLTVSPDMRLFVHTIYRPEIYWVEIPYSEDVIDEQES
ncbi:MAG: hypothetical protein ACOCX5_00370 [Chloroflexota bacterium]